MTETIPKLEYVTIKRSEYDYLRAVVEGEAVRDLVIEAYKQGALDVHNAWVESLGEENAPSRDPDFTEAAHDYANDALRCGHE